MIMMIHYLSCVEPQVEAVSCRRDESVVRIPSDINADMGPSAWSDEILFLQQPII